MEPEWTSCLKTWVCWDFRSVPLYPATFRSFHLCIFSFLFSSFIYLFSSLHNLYTYCNLLMFFLDFTSITCSLSPLSYFWWECMPVYVFVCSCVHVLWRSEGSLHCQSSAAFLFETVSLMTWSFGSKHLCPQHWDHTCAQLFAWVLSRWTWVHVLAKYFTNWGIFTIPFSIFLILWPKRQLELGCAFCFRAVILKSIFFFLWTELVIFPIEFLDFSY